MDLPLRRTRRLPSAARNPDASLLSSSAGAATSAMASLCALQRTPVTLLYRSSSDRSQEKVQYAAPAAARAPVAASPSTPVPAAPRLFTPLPVPASSTSSRSGLGAASRAPWLRSPADEATMDAQLRLLLLGASQAPLAPAAAPMAAEPWFAEVNEWVEQVAASDAIAAGPASPLRSDAQRLANAGKSLSTLRSWLNPVVPSSAMERNAASRRARAALALPSPATAQRIGRHIGSLLPPLQPASPTAAPSVRISRHGSVSINRAAPLDEGTAVHVVQHDEDGHLTLLRSMFLTGAKRPPPTPPPPPPTPPTPPSASPPPGVHISRRGSITIGHPAQAAAAPPQSPPRAAFLVSERLREMMNLVSNDIDELNRALDGDSSSAASSPAALPLPLAAPEGAVPIASPSIVRPAVHVSRHGSISIAPPAKPSPVLSVQRSPVPIQQQLPVQRSPVQRSPVQRSPVQRSPVHVSRHGSISIGLPASQQALAPTPTPAAAPAPQFPRGADIAQIQRAEASLLAASAELVKQRAELVSAATALLMQRKAFALEDVKVSPTARATMVLVKEAQAAERAAELPWRRATASASPTATVVVALPNRDPLFATPSTRGATTRRTLLQQPTKTPIAMPPPRAMEMRPPHTTGRCGRQLEQSRPVTASVSPPPELPSQSLIPKRHTAAPSVRVSRHGSVSISLPAAAPSRSLPGPLAALRNDPPRAARETPKRKAFGGGGGAVSSSPLPVKLRDARSRPVRRRPLAGAAAAAAPLPLRPRWSTAQSRPSTSTDNLDLRAGLRKLRRASPHGGGLAARQAPPPEQKITEYFAPRSSKEQDGAPDDARLLGKLQAAMLLLSNVAEGDGNSSVDDNSARVADKLQRVMALMGEGRDALATIGLALEDNAAASAKAAAPTEEMQQTVPSVVHITRHGSVTISRPELDAATRMQEAYDEERRAAAHASVYDALAAHAAANVAFTVARRAASEAMWAANEAYSQLKEDLAVRMMQSTVRVRPAKREVRKRRHLAIAREKPRPPSGAAAASSVAKSPRAVAVVNDLSNALSNNDPISAGVCLLSLFVSVPLSSPFSLRLTIGISFEHTRQGDCSLTLPS